MSPSADGVASFVWRQRVAADSKSAAAALGLVAILPLGYSDGGYYESTWRWATVAFIAIVGIGLLLARRPEPTRLEWIALGSLMALGALMAVSASWGIAGSEGLREAERCALYVAILGALLVVVRSSTASALLGGVVAATGALALVGLARRIADPPPLDPYQGSLLTDPVGYANALGIVLGIGVVLALGFLCDVRRWTPRVVLAGLLCMLGAALVLTSSRGAWLATIVGAIVLVGVRADLARARWTFAALIVCAVVVAIGIVGRVSLGDRPQYWRTAITDASEHPALGSGAGTFDDYWLRHRPIPAYVRDAHSLYLETAAELGTAGLALLICALAAPLLAVRNVENRALLATALGGYTAFLVHAGLDWDWEMPVTTVAGLACGGALLAATRRD